MDFDIGLLFSVFVGCVGAVELISVVQYISDQLIFSKDREENKDKLQNDIEKIQENLRESISLIENNETNDIKSMKDGILYKDGFRQDDQPKDQELLDKYNKRMLEISLGDKIVEEEESTKKIERTNSEDEPSSSNHGEFSEDYLRSLDGVKNRPLVRDDGTGRRRAFKKRNSSSSISSQESKASREEELKMFTSMEEEELSYSSDTNVKVKKHSKRHKRSPIKETKSKDDDSISRSSLEDVDEIEGEEEEIVESPWGDINPAHHKSSEFLRGDSIVEEDSDEELPKSEKIVRTVRSSNLSEQNIPKLSSFEEATDSQHDEAINILNKSDDFQKNKMEDKTNDKNVSSNDDDILIPALSDNQNETKSDVECFSHDLDDSSDLLLQKIEQEIDEKIIDWTGSSRDLNDDETDQKIQEFTNYIEKLNGVKPTPTDMKDESNESEQDFSYLPHIGNEKEFTYESDEEPFLDDGCILRRIFEYSEEEDYDAIEGDISSDEEPYIKTIHESKHRNLLDSDEEPSSKDMKIEVNVNVNVNVKMIKRRRKKVNKMEEDIDTADDHVIIPELGTENDYIVHSDEEPKRDGFKEIFAAICSESESDHEQKTFNSDEEQFFKTTRSIAYRNTLDSDEEPSSKHMSIRFEHDSSAPQTSNKRCKRAIDMQEPLEYPEDHAQLQPIGTELEFVLDLDEETNFVKEQSTDKIQTQEQIDEEQFYSDRRPRDREDREIDYPEDFLIIQTIGNEDEFKLDLDEDPDREERINWNKFSNVEEEVDDGTTWSYKVYDSDEEPIFNHLRRNAIDMQEVIEFNEDYSYLPELGTENFYTMDSDEEPDRVKLPHSQKYSHVEEEHSKVEIKIEYESDEEPNFKGHKIHHHTNNDMNDHLDSDDDYSYLKNFVKEKSKDINDDEEPEYVRIKIRYAASSSREIEADTHKISHIVESDEEPFLKETPELKIFKDDWDDDNDVSDVCSKNGEHSQTTQIYIQKRKEADEDIEDNEYEEDDEDEEEFEEIIDGPGTDHRRRRRLRKITAYLVYARRTPRIDHSDHSDHSETDDMSFVESSRSRSNTEEIREDMAEGGGEGTLDEENEENVWEDQGNGVHQDYRENSEGYQKLPIDLDDEDKSLFLHHDVIVDSSIYTKPSASSSSNFIENEIKSSIMDKTAVNKSESPEFSGKNKKRHKKRKSIQMNEDSSPEKDKKEETTLKRGSKKKKKDKKLKKSDDSCMDLLMDSEMFPFKQ